MVFTVFSQLLRGNLRALFEDYKGLDKLSSDFVLFSYRDGGVDCWMLAKRSFDLLRIDVEAADDYDIGCAVDYFYIPVFVYAHHVACVEPTVGRKALARVLLVTKVAADDSRPLEVQAAVVMLTQFVAFACAYLFFLVIKGWADCTEFLRRLAAVDGHDGAAFC